jgi:type II secretory pathway pseudopilin PulG
MVEVMVAMLIFAVLAVASLGFVVTSLSATALARTDTVAKNLTQELLESMRNLPYFTHANVSTVPDLLDTYYTSTSTPAATVDSSGFVADGTPRDTAKGDPATGPFYRRVLGPAPGYAAFERRVTAQFLGSESSVLASPLFVSTATDSTGLPPSSALSVRVTTRWSSGDEQQSFTVESEIAEGTLKPPLVTLQGRLSMLRFTGILPDARELVTEAGVVNVDGSLSSATVASAVAQGAHSTIADGSTVPADGARATLKAPPTTALTVDPVGPKTLMHGPEVAAFAGTSLSGLTVHSDGGQPGAGTATQPVAAVLNGNGSGSDWLRASNLPTTGSATRLRLLDGPVVRGASDTCGGDCEAVKATGSLVSTGGAAHAATATLGGLVTGTVSLLPTVDSPDGLVRVTLSSLSATCESHADPSLPGTVSVSYAGTVTHRTYDPLTGMFGYSAPITIAADPTAETPATDPLAAVDPQTYVGIDGTTGLPLRLADYVQSWSSLTDDAVTDAAVVAVDGSAAGVTLPGVFTFTSMPLRSELTSTFGLQLGALSCTASDIR